MAHDAPDDTSDDGCLRCGGPLEDRTARETEICADCRDNPGDDGDGFLFDELATSDTADADDEPVVADDSARADDAGASTDGSAARTLGIATGKGIASIPATVVTTAGKAVGGVAYGITKVFPGGHALWQGLFKTAVKNMHRTSGADIVGFVKRPTGEVEPVPMKWKNAADNPEEGGKWHARGSDEEWNPGTLGQQTQRIGKTPVGWFHEDNPNEISALAPRIAEAADLGQTHELYNPEAITITETYITPDGDPVDGGGDEAVADGGQAQYGGAQYEIKQRGWLDSLEDVIVDLDSGADSKGMRISWDKAHETLQEKTTTEEMQMQEQRGRIAESDPEAQRQKWMRILLYFVIAVIGVRMGPALVAKIFGSAGGGGGGGSGGSVIPFMVGVLPL